MTATKGSPERLIKRKAGGFSAIQLLITVAVITVISTFAMIGIRPARASMRLRGSTRELAGYLEKARGSAIRGNSNTTVTVVDANSYRLNMDFDGDGVVDARTVTLQDGVTFTPGSIGVVVQFDWRGRIPNQVGIVLTNGQENRPINISGSGDVTLGEEIFQDALIENVNLNANVPAGVASPPGGTSPTPTPTPTASPSVTPMPDPTPAPTPTPTPDPAPTPIPTPTPTPEPTPTPTPTPVPTATPTPTPTPIPCSIVAPASVTLSKNQSPQSFSVTVNNGNGTTITATRSGGILTVSPATTTVSGTGTISYTVTYGSGNISGSVTLTSACGTQTISITVN